MAARRQRIDLNDIFNESEESDQEFVCLASSIPFDELRHEVDVARYYRALSKCSMLRNRAAVPTRRHKSTQTEPEFGNIPPSWILEGEKLIEEIYSGLGNMINSMYHTPTAHVNQSVMDSKKMKYFTYENGYWQSVLLPNVKIPAVSDMDKQNRMLYSEDTKNKLRHLQDKATKLRSIIPYLTGEKYLEPQMDGDKACPDDISSKELKRGQTPCECSCNPDVSCNHIHEMEIDAGVSDSKGDFKRSQTPCESSCDPGVLCNHVDEMDLNEGIVDHGDSGRSSGCSAEYCPPEKLKEIRVKESATMTQSRIMDGMRKPNQVHVPGISISAYKSAKASSYPQCNMCAPNVKLGSESGHPIHNGWPSVVKPASTEGLASCSRESEDKKRKVNHVDTRKEIVAKRLLIGQENIARSKARADNSQTNFIKRNIMALRNTVNHVGSHAVRNDPNFNSVTHETRMKRVKQIR